MGRRESCEVGGHPRALPRRHRYLNPGRRRAARECQLTSRCPVAWWVQRSSSCVGGRAGVRMRCGCVRASPRQISRHGGLDEKGSLLADPMPSTSLSYTATTVNWRIGDDLKECALSLWNHGLDLEDICKALGVSKASCYYRWRKVVEEHGNVNRPTSSLVGRTRKITRAKLGTIEQLYSEDSDPFLNKVAHGLLSNTRLEPRSQHQGCLET